MEKQAFKEWMAKVDATLEKMLGLMNTDLADMPYREWYEKGMTSTAAAIKAVKAQGILWC